MRRAIGIFIIISVILASRGATVTVAQTGSYVLTVGTDKLTYNLQEKVKVAGNLRFENATYNLTIANALVGVQITTPDNPPKTLLYRTLKTGDTAIPPGDVEVVAVFACNDAGQPISPPVFSRGALASFKVTIRNNVPESRSGYVAVTCFYEPYEIPFYAIEQQFTMADASTLSIVFSIPIPSDAVQGSAKIYASAYAYYLPEIGGYPYCEERSSSFLISDLGGGSGVEPQAQESPPAGSYATQFEIPEDAALGKYTVYATANKGISSNKSQIKVAEFNVVRFARLRIDPRLSITGLGETSQYNLSIIDVSNLTKWEAKVYYNSSILNGTSVAEGAFLSAINTTAFEVLQFTDNYNETHGLIDMSCYLTSSETWASGNGTLATIAFKAKASRGETLLHLEDTKLYDNSTPPSTFEHTTIDGQVYLGVHDIAVTNVFTYKTVVGEGSILHVDITVTNQGHYNETFTVTLYAETTAVASTSINLLSSISATITLNWTTTGYTIYSNYTLTAEASTVPDEIDTTNNEYTDGIIQLVIQGDVNADRTVNLFDAVRLAAAAGSCPGRDKWDPNSDLNDDRIINLFDGVLLSLHAGQSAP